MSHTAEHGHGNGSGHDITHVHESGQEHMTPVGDVKAPKYKQVEYKFSFKKQVVKDETTGEEVKRPPVILTVPVPTFDGLVDAFKDDKVTNFVLDLVEEAIKDQVRAQISDDERPVNRQEDLDLSKLTLEYIANMPKTERTGGGISKDTWADWEKDYIEVMSRVRNSVDKATKAAKLMVGRFNQVRTDKQVLKFLREQLSQWATESPNAEDYTEVYAYLDQRATDLMSRDNVSQLANLM